MATINISSFRSITTIKLCYKNHCCRHSVVASSPQWISSLSSSRNYFSTNSSPSTTDDNNTSTVTTTTSTSSSEIFPWRHSSTLLPRIATLDDLSGQPNNYRGRLIRSLLVARELNTPFWSILFGSWKDDLAKDMVWAWRTSLIGVLSNTFGVPMDEINNPSNDDNNNLTISLNRTTLNNKLTLEQQEETNEFLSATLDQNLINLYNNNENLDANSNIEITFTLQPQSYKIQSAFLVPMFTRSHTLQNPNLKGAYTKIEAEFQKTGSPKIVQEMANDIVQNEMNGETGYRSIIVDVVVDCLESFRIVDRSIDVLKMDGGKGEKEENVEVKEVCHLIRFEMETSSGVERGERVLGNWKITDWDDLLEGNVWH